MKSLNNTMYPYSLTRNTTYAKNGMVATSQPLAAQAGLDILQKGGNAVDAAIATAACLTVVEPTSNGIGGDAFAIVWMNNELYGLNSSGKSPRNISIDALKEAGHDSIPAHGWIPVTVPGAPGAWAELSERFGKLSLLEVLQPAIYHAENGYPVSPTVARFWNKEYQNFKKVLKGDMFSEWFNIFTPKGRAPNVGETWASIDHAETLRAIGESNGQSFYKGELAKKISEFSRQYNGFLNYDDLASFKPEWVDPIKVNYRGYDIWEIPPNGQGIVALMALNMLKEYSFDNKDCPEAYHKQIEALKLAYTDGLKHVTEDNHMRFSHEALLSEEFATQRRNLIRDIAIQPTTEEPALSGTVYLATADSERNMVSFIQSNYKGFGSGLVVPGTGIALQNRGLNFSFDPNHVNALKGGKKTYHTIIPGFVTKKNRAIGPFGVMGGFMQPQGHLQVIMNAIDFNLNPQSSLDAPRWRWMKGKKIQVESRFPHHIANKLIEKGHDVSVQIDSNSFGRGQIIWHDLKQDTLVGGTETRADGSIACW